MSLELATAPGATQSFGFHQSSHRAVRDVNVLPVELLPDFLGAVDTIAIGLVHASNLGFESLIPDLPRTRGPRLGGVIGTGGELQYSADRFDSPSMPARLDVTNYRLV